MSLDTISWTDIHIHTYKRRYHTEEVFKTDKLKFVIAVTTSRIN